MLNNFLGAIAVPVVVLDSDLKVVAANKPARKAFARLKIGLGVDKAGSLKSGFRKKLLKSLDKSIETSSKVKLKQGFDQEFRATIKPFGSGNDTDPDLLMVTFEDRSPLKDVKAMRSDFVANVSHEIRSPLTAISGFVETLQGAAKDDPEAQAHFMGMMASEVERMTNLVADLLSLSQVEVKERRTPKKTVDPNQIIAQAVAAVSPLAQRCGKVVSLQTNGTLPALPGQYNDLVRVLINLLENAINYSREDSEIRLTANVMSVENPLNKPALCIAVQDQGDGIPPQDIPRLTERFYRVDKSRSRNIGGTGLGLAIVKHILVRHRGKLLIDSVPGQGSTFAVYLPLGKPGKS
jgi:two-component system phosphate regulon sensor histidine kinase PhoR